MMLFILLALLLLFGWKRRKAVNKKLFGFMDDFDWDKETRLFYKKVIKKKSKR